MNWFKSLWGGAANLGRSDNETIQQRIRRHFERRGGTPAVWFAPDQFCSSKDQAPDASNRLHPAVPTAMIGGGTWEGAHARHEAAGCCSAARWCGGGVAAGRSRAAVGDR